jgi:hypothetical protein
MIMSCAVAVDNRVDDVLYDGGNARKIEKTEGTWV